MEGGPPCFPQTHRGSWYSGHSWPSLTCPYGALTHSGGAFQRLRVGSGWLVCCSYNPTHSWRGWFGLIPSRSPLLRDSRLISLRRATEMFQFAHGPPTCLWIQQVVSRHHSGRVAPFGFSGLFARMQLPLNVSPVSASFVGLQRLGIHLVLLFACAPLSLRSSRLLCLFSRSLLALGKIEVIMLFDCSMYRSGS